jgi:hypothetical protein
VTTPIDDVEYAVIMESNRLTPKRRWAVVILGGIGLTSILVRWIFIDGDVSDSWGLAPGVLEGAVLLGMILCVVIGPSKRSATDAEKNPSSGL